MTRHEQRYKAMTILYQANLYKNNNIETAIKESYNYLKENKEEFISKCNNQ